MNVKLSDVTGIADPATQFKDDDHLLIDLLPFAYLISSNFQDVFIAPEKGLYLETSTKPVLRMDQQFQIKSVPFAVTLNDIDVTSLNEPIYDLNGSLIAGMGNGYPQLYFGSPLPLTELQVVQTFCENEIYDRLSWNPRIKRRSLRDLVDMTQFMYVDNRGTARYDYEQIEERYDQIVAKVNTVLDSLAIILLGYISGKNWNMYDLLFQNTMAYIRRGVDYRIYEWTRIHHEVEQEKLRISRGE